MTRPSTTRDTTATAADGTVRVSRPSVLAGSAVCVGLTLSCVLALVLRPSLPGADLLRVLWPIGALTGPVVAAYRLGDSWHRGVAAAAYAAATGVGALLGFALAYRTLTHVTVGLPWALTAAVYVLPVFALGSLVGGVVGTWLHDYSALLGDRRSRAPTADDVDAASANDASADDGPTIALDVGEIEDDDADAEGADADDRDTGDDGQTASRDGPPDARPDDDSSPRRRP